MYRNLTTAQLVALLDTLRITRSYDERSQVAAINAELRTR